MRAACFWVICLGTFYWIVHKGLFNKMPPPFQQNTRPPPPTQTSQKHPSLITIFSERKSPERSGRGGEFLTRLFLRTHEGLMSHFFIFLNCHEEVCYWLKVYFFVKIRPVYNSLKFFFFKSGLLSWGKKDTRTHADTHGHTNTHTNGHTHTHIHTHTHTFTQTFTHTPHIHTHTLRIFKKP